MGKKTIHINEIYHHATKKNDPNAQCQLGIYYLNGLYVTQNRTKAVMWFEKAANNNNPVAQHNLGVCYLNGWGATQNRTKAVRWFRQAAEQGHTEAQTQVNNLTSGSKTSSQEDNLQPEDLTTSPVVDSETSLSPENSLPESKPDNHVYEKIDSHPVWKSNILTPEMKLANEFSCVLFRYMKKLENELDKCEKFDSITVYDKSHIEKITLEKHKIVSKALSFLANATCDPTKLNEPLSSMNAVFELLKTNKEILKQRRDTWLMEAVKVVSTLGLIHLYRALMGDEVTEGMKLFNFFKPQNDELNNPPSSTHSATVYVHHTGLL